MSRRIPIFALVLCASTSVCSAHAAASSRPLQGHYQEVIERVVGMAHDPSLQSRVRRYGLNVVNVMWEDTGRHTNSSVGPNISDLTLQVRQKQGRRVVSHLLPVIRYPNFSDKTGDIRADKLWVRVGNHLRGGSLRAVPLTDVLRNMRDYLSDPSSLRGSDNFLAARDSHLLVNAQHVFVPIPKGGKAEFNPVLFNYQSAVGAPAVLTLLITREGTSAAIIENRGGSQSWQSWGQQLYFNRGGQSTVFTAERKSDVKARIDSGRGTAADAGALQEGADMMMLVQVPLRYTPRHRGMLGSGGFGGYGLESKSAQPSMKSAPSSAPKGKSGYSRRHQPTSNVEQAVIGHGEDMGHYAEMGGMRLQRDPRFPIRVTVQFYRATSNGVVSDADLAEVHRNIKRVYADADYVGSLVMPSGDRHRPTDWHVRPRYPTSRYPTPPQWGFIDSRRGYVQ